ncbi:MAG: TIR domain-containing protein, partial [Hyphomicrobiaceae bacterium]
MTVEAVREAAGIEPDKIDFFLSRTGKDKDIAILIDRILRAAGATTLLEDNDFVNMSFMAMMAKGWSSGAQLICILSADYQRSEHCKKEYEVALAHDPRNLKRRVIVLRVAECDPIEHLADLAYTDLVPVLHDATELARVVRGAVGLSKDEAETDLAVFHGRAPRQIVHPSIEANPSFAGREEDIARIESVLSTGRTAALTNFASVAAMSGLGGVGKSVLAREFAWRNRERYQGVWWIGAEKPETLLDDLIELGSHFIAGLEAADDRAKAARAALDCIWQGKFPLPWLLVYD